MWGSRSVIVKGNKFAIDASVVKGCTTAANLCGVMENAAFNAGVPKLMRFFYQYETFIARSSGGFYNVWLRNTYAWTGRGSGCPFPAAPPAPSLTRTQAH